MIVEFENALGKRKIIGNCESHDEAWKTVRNYLKESFPEYKPSYYRAWGEDKEVTVIDFGSHNEFFLIINE